MHALDGTLSAMAEGTFDRAFLVKERQGIDTRILPPLFSSALE